MEQVRREPRSTPFKLVKLAARLRLLNRGAEELFGYPAEEAIGQPITMLIPDERLSEEDEILSRLRAGQKIDHFETIRRRKDGALIEISVTVSPVANEAGTILMAMKPTIASPPSATVTSQPRAISSSTRRRRSAGLGMWGGPTPGRLAPACQIAVIRSRSASVAGRRQQGVNTGSSHRISRAIAPCVDTRASMQGGRRS